MPGRSNSPAGAAMIVPDRDAQPLPPATGEVQVEVYGGIEGAPGQDVVAEEVPVAMVYNGISHAVMMASPGQLEDFAVGFSLTEGILDWPEQLFGMEVRTVGDGIFIEMHIAGDCFARLREQRRNMTGRTGCGLCGTDSLAHAIRPIQQVPAQPIPDDVAVQLSLTNLRNHQPLQSKTGATHGAVWCDSRGRILRAREDVGRHNALDKLIGARIREYGATAFNNGFALISSRASFEMVHKCASVGIPCLVAVSAPTALAIREALEAQMTLIGFARPGRHVIYARGGDQPFEESEDE